MKDRGFEALFNAAYSPEYMPIEFVFSVVKRKFKQQKTNAIVNEKSVKTISLIKQSFESVSLLTVQHCIEHCLKKFDQISQDWDSELSLQ